MKLSHGLAAIALTMSAAAAHAEVTGTVTAVSDYDFRGITQTAHDPALQGSLDWTHSSGVYAGAWASSGVDFSPGGNLSSSSAYNESWELDLYGGWRGGETVAWDLGGIYYTYPGAHDLAYPEIYASATWKVLTGKVWYSWDFAQSNKSAEYYQLDANFPLPANFSANAHYGYSDGDFWDYANNGGYSDWSVGLNYTWSHFTLSLKWVDGSDLSDLDDLCHQFEGECSSRVNKDVASTDPRAIFSISTTFPWAKE